MKKKPTLYIVILCVWVLCLSVLGVSLYFILTNLQIENLAAKITASILLTLNTLVLGILWFGSLKDLIFSIAFATTGKKMLSRYKDIYETKVDEDYNPKFLLLYCTRNDFNRDALLKCMA